MYLQDVRVGAALVRLAVLRVLEQHLVHVRAGVLEQAVGAVEDDEGDLTVAQHAQLVRLLHQAKLALGEGDLWCENTHTHTHRGLRHLRSRLLEIYW